MLLRTLAGFVCFALMASAQTSQAQYPGESEPFFKRFSYGIKAGGLITGLMKSQTVTESTTSVDPPLTTITSNDSAGKRYTVGPTLGFRLTDNVDLRLDVLFKRVGYNYNVTTQTQLTEEEIEDGDSADFISGDYTRNRGDQWDIAVLGRYYSKGYNDEGPRLFFTGGPALSTISGIKSFYEHINDELLSDTNSIPIEPAHTTVPGVTVGAGVQFRDDFNLKFEIEGRFTRWFGQIFDSGMTQSSVNQAELFVSFSF